MRDFITGGGRGAGYVVMFWSLILLTVLFIILTGWALKTGDTLQTFLFLGLAVVSVVGAGYVEWESG